MSKELSTEDWKKVLEDLRNWLGEGFWFCFSGGEPFLRQYIVSLAKRIEEVFVPNNSQSVIFPLSSPALFFFQRIRDEAHRFAITFHRQLRGKEAIHSELDDIKGLFDKNKKLLIEKYGSVKKISKLTKEELLLILSKNQSSLVYNYFNKISFKDV